MTNSATSHLLMLEKQFFYELCIFLVDRPEYVWLELGKIPLRRKEYPPMSPPCLGYLSQKILWICEFMNALAYR